MKSQIRTLLEIHSDFERLEEYFQHIFERTRDKDRRIRYDKARAISTGMKEVCNLLFLQLLEDEQKEAT